MSISDSQSLSQPLSHFLSARFFTLTLMTIRVLQTRHDAWKSECEVCRDAAELQALMHEFNVGAVDWDLALQRFKLEKQGGGPYSAGTGGRQHAQSSVKKVTTRGEGLLPGKKKPRMVQTDGEQGFVGVSRKSEGADVKRGWRYRKGRWMYVVLKEDNNKVCLWCESVLCVCVRV